MAKHASAPKIPALIYAISKKMNRKTNHIYASLIMTALQAYVITQVTFAFYRLQKIAE